MFILLIFLTPKLYDWLSADPLRGTNDSRLQEVASLMDDIYTTLANMTFIPASAIKRGPHYINTTAFPCDHDQSVLRVMELMPYVDHIEVEEDPINGKRTLRTDWLYGGEFVNYRTPLEMEESCDPLRGWSEPHATWYAVTSWGSGGWNGDRTNVLVYDTSINAIAVWEGEDWVHMIDEDEPWKGRGSYYDYTGIGLFNHSISRPLVVLPRTGFEWKHWADAPTVLRRILHAYQTLAWTPWETSNREDGWGIPVEDIRALLQKHGWPDEFEPDNFNAAFIRAKHSAITTHGPAEAVHKQIIELEGEPDLLGAGAIYGSYEQLISFQAQKREDKNEEWFWTYRTQVTRWTLDRQQADLELAKQEFDRLCPDSVCVKPGEAVLWELYSVEKEYMKMQRSTPVEEQCSTELWSWKVDDGVNVTETMQRSCVANRQRTRDWTRLAYEQAQADALTYSERTGCELIPRPTLEQLVHERIAKLERDIDLSLARAEAMEAWLPTLPEDAEKARRYFAMDLSGYVNGPHYLREEMEWFEKELEGGQDGKGHERLWRCFDHGEGCSYVG
jgi:hypothetical protein